METTSFQIQAQIARYTTAKLGRLRIKSYLMKFRFLGEGKPEWTERDLSEQKTNKFNNSQQEAMSRNHWAHWSKLALTNTPTLLP